MADKYSAQLAPGIPIPGPEGPAGEPGPEGPPGVAGPSSALGLGSVSPGGVLAGPTGWTCQHALLGKYVIVHGLHLDPASYTVLAVLTGPPAASDPLAQNPSMLVTVDSQSEDSFTIQCYQGTSLQNAAFNFGVFQ